MKNSIKILSDITKKDTERCLVLVWFMLMNHLR
jgi:hypothetical protein